MADSKKGRKPLPPEKKKREIRIYLTEEQLNLLGGSVRGIYQHLEWCLKELEGLDTKMGRKDDE